MKNNKILIAFALGLTLVSPVWSDYNSDMRGAWVLSQKREYMKARETYHAIAEKETNTKRKNVALTLAAIQLEKDGKVDESLSELSAFPFPEAKLAWVEIVLSRKKATSEQVEPILAQISALDIPQGKARLYLIRTYFREGKLEKAKASILAMASESPSCTAAILPEITQRSMSLFSSKADQIEFYNSLLRVTPATEKNSKTIGLIKSQIEVLK